MAEQKDGASTEEKSGSMLTNILARVGWKTFAITAYLLIMAILFVTTIRATPSYENLFGDGCNTAGSSASHNSGNEPVAADQRHSEEQTPVEAQPTGPDSLWTRFRKAMPPGRSLALVLFAICVAPYPFTVWLSQLIQRNLATEFVLSLPEDNKDSDPYWSMVYQTTVELWTSERTSRSQAFAKAHDFAHMLGFLVSSTLAASSVTLLHSVVGAMHNGGVPRAAMVAIAVGMATIVAFGIEAGRIAVRVATFDASSKMFARAVQTLLSVIIAAFFLPTVLMSAASSQIANSVTSIAILGAAVGILGRRALAFAVDRAQTALQGPVVNPQDRSDLAQLDGITDDDIDRLSEEGIVSVHALAFCSPAKLYFNTVYPLARVCDWQDQALLIEYFGKSKSQNLRENVGIRGAIGAQAVAGWLANQKPNGPGTQYHFWPNGQTQEEQKEGGGANANPSAQKRQDVYRALGFATEQLAAISLAAFVQNPYVDRLRVLRTAAVVKLSGHGETPGSDDPNKGRFGGLATKNDYQLSARYLKQLGETYWIVELSVSPTTPEKTLEGEVTFVLHPTFNPRERKIKAVNNSAVLQIAAWGVFTVGAIMPDRSKLELDLADVDGADSDFYTR